MNTKLKQINIKNFFASNNDIIIHLNNSYTMSLQECNDLYKELYNFVFPNNDFSKFNDNNKFIIGPIINSIVNNFKIYDYENKLVIILLLLRAFYDCFAKDDNYINESQKLIKLCLFKDNSNELKFKFDDNIDNLDELVNILKTGEIDSNNIGIYSICFKSLRNKVIEFLELYPSYFSFVPSKIINNAFMYVITSTSNEDVSHSLNVINSNEFIFDNFKKFKSEFNVYKKSREKKEKFIYSEIKYKPFLSILALKYISVVVFCLGLIASVLKVQLYLNKSSDFEFETNVINFILNILKYVGKAGLPLMVIWLISQVISFKDSALKMVIIYGVTAIVFYLAEILIVINYIIPNANRILESYIGVEIPKEIWIGVSGYASNLNVFIDMFLCSLIYLFTMTLPKKIKTKKGKILFRSCAIFPALYILIAFIVSGLETFGVESMYVFMNLYVGSLLPSKNIMVFVIFIMILIYIKIRQKIYNKFNHHGMTYEEYEKTNRYSFNYSIIASIIIAFGVGVDSLISLIPYSDYFGFGNSLTFLIAIPFLLVHNLTTKPTRKISMIWTGFIYAFSYIILAAVSISIASQVSNSINKYIETLFEYFILFL